MEPPGPGDQRRTTRRGRAGHDTDGIGQIPGVPGAGSRGGDPTRSRPGSLPVPAQGAGSGSARQVPAARPRRRTRRRGGSLLDLRRRHPEAPTRDDPRPSPARPDLEPRHAAPRHPLQRCPLGRDARGSPLDRARRAAHLPGHLRLSLPSCTPATAAGVPTLRQRTSDHRVLCHRDQRRRLRADSRGAPVHRDRGVGRAAGGPSLPADAAADQPLLHRPRTPRPLYRPGSQDHRLHQGATDHRTAAQLARASRRDAGATRRQLPCGLSAGGAAADRAGPLRRPPTGCSRHC